MFTLKFANSIKKKYRDRLINREQQWPYCHGDKLIHLSLIEGERGIHLKKSKSQVNETLLKRDEEKTKLKRTPIAYADLFKVEGKKKCVRKVLVEGDAGIGKTTLCTIMSEDWANDKLFQQFELLLLLPLREREVAKASSLLELLKLFHSSESLCTSVAHFIEEDEGENTLIVADGWDELSVDERNVESFLYKLLFGKIFPFMSVVVTSRYSASASLHNLPHIDRFIEIRGFNKESIKDFIESEFTEDRIVGRNLLKKLENSALIGSVCSVPLCCVIICHLWRTLQEDLPTTMTELYTKITLNILIRNVRKGFPENDDSLTQSFSNFDSLPENLKQSWSRLCEFAFLTITKDKIVFSRDELARCWSHGSIIDENIFRFGLLQAAQSIFAVGSGTSFHFLHLTFQEYLAALYLSRQPLDIQVHACERYAKTSRFDMVVRFLFGITAQKCDSEEAIDKLLMPIRRSCTPWTICHCLFEAGHNNLTPVGNICELLLKNHYLPKSSYTAHDFSALIHIISHTHHRCSVSISFTDCGITNNQIITFGRALAAKKGNLQMENLNLSGNKLTTQDMSALFSSETVFAFKSLMRLTIDCNEIGAKGLESVMTTLKSAQCNISTLSLSYNPLGISGLQVLEHTICSGALTGLAHLTLQGSLTTDADINATLLISLSASLSVYCPMFGMLDVSENNLGVPGARALGTVLTQLNQHENDTAIHLELANANFCCGPSVSNIKFSCYKFQSVSLNLSDNPIGLEGVTTIGHMISNNQISALYMNKCQLTCNTISFHHVEAPSSSNNSGQNCTTVSSVGSQLSTLQPSSTLTVLDLNGNDFSGKNIDILAGFMHLCPFLSDLRCSNCGINSHDIENLFIRLIEMNSRPLLNLVSWWLEENKIEDIGVSTLIKYLPSLFPNLKGVCFDNNMVNRDMRHKFRDILNQVNEIYTDIHNCAPYFNTAYVRFKPF